MTNSEEGLALRKEYLGQFDRCQFGYKSGVGFKHGCQRDTVIVHHVFSRGLGGGLADTFSNYLSACDRCHKWLHRYPLDGRMIVMPLKIELAKIWDGDHISALERFQYDASELRAAAGYDVVGRIENVVELHDAGVAEVSDHAVECARDFLESACCF